MKTKKKKKAKKLTTSQLKNEADRIFSIYIRQRDDGLGCISCGVQKPWKEMQNGHFVSRRHLSTRYHEWNCNSQCWQCNVPLKGNMVKYAVNLKLKYGDGIIEELDNLSKQIGQFKRADYEFIINTYKT